MIEIITENTVLGATYSQSNYEDFKENKNIFEEVIDALMLDQYSDEPELTEFIKTLPGDKKRLAILSLLDKDNNMWLKLKSMLGDNNLSKVAQIKDVVLMLREYVKIAEVEKKKFGEVMTPLELVKEMLATLPVEVWSNPDLKWLDPANGTGPYPIMVIYKLMKGLEKWQPDEELRYKHIIENMIYVCELQPKNMFLYLCATDPKDEYNCNVYTGSFLEEGFDKHMKEIWNVDKFDVVIGNPPYNQNIDLKFLKKSHDISDDVLFIHPSVWIIDNKLKNKTFIETREYVKDRLYSFILLNANKAFNIGLFSPCIITYITKYKSDDIKVINKISNKEYITTEIENIDLYDCNENYLSIKEKIKEYCKINGSLWDNCKRDYNGTHTTNEKEFEVGFSPIRGHVSQQDDTKMVMDDFYTFIQKKDEDKHLSINYSGTKYKLKFGFDTLYESKSFIDYLKSDFARFCVSIYKNSQTFHGGELLIVPYLKYDKIWSEVEIIKEFNLSREEMEFIKSVIPKYY